MDIKEFQERALVFTDEAAVFEVVMKVGDIPFKYQNKNHLTGHAIVTNS